MNLPKNSGRPLQESKAKLVKGEIYSSMVAGESYNIPLTFQNIGQSIWNEYDDVQLRMIQGQEDLGSRPVIIPAAQKIKPGEEFTFVVPVKVPKSGDFKILLQLYHNNQSFHSPPLEFHTAVKSPVILNVNASLLWKNNFSGEYLLSAVSGLMNNTVKVKIDDKGQAKNVEMKYLLPDYTFDFTLQKPFYKSKTIQTKVLSGVNILDFGNLEPDFFSVVVNPQALWRLLPFSN
jgi:hypothetical protein